MEKGIITMDCIRNVRLAADRMKKSFKPQKHTIFVKLICTERRWMSENHGEFRIK